MFYWLPSGPGYSTVVSPHQYACIYQAEFIRQKYLCVSQRRPKGVRPTWCIFIGEPTIVELTFPGVPVVFILAQNCLVPVVSMMMFRFPFGRLLLLLGEAQGTSASDVVCIDPEGGQVWVWDYWGRHIDDCIVVHIYVLVFRKRRKVVDKSLVKFCVLRRSSNGLVIQI